MPAPPLMFRFGLAAIAVLLAVESASAQQQLGTKVMGGLGIDAGAQPPPGVYVVERFFQFRATRVRDRDGNIVPIQGFNLLARANGLGFAFTVPVANGPLLTFGLSVPYARISVNSDEPLASVDQFGLGDLFVQPIKAGWRYPRYDFVMAYGFFAPTGSFEPKTGVGAGRGHWTNQVSVGGALYADSARTWRGSALLSYDMNGRKRGVDITRGNFLALQGGAGASIRRVVVAGIAGYGLWQVNDDRGSQLPAKLAGSHTYGYGLGPELDVTIPSLRLKLEARYVWDFAVRARPEGSVLALGFSYGAWLPPRPH